MDSIQKKLLYIDRLDEIKKKQRKTCDWVDLPAAFLFEKIKNLLTNKKNDGIISFAAEKTP